MNIVFAHSFLEKNNTRYLKINDYITHHFLLLPVVSILRRFISQQYCQLSKLVKKPSTVTTGNSTVSLASCVPTNTPHIWPLTVCICSVIHSTYVNVVYLAEDFSLYLYIVSTCIHRANTFILKRNLQIYTCTIQVHTFIRSIFCHYSIYF